MQKKLVSIVTITFIGCIMASVSFGQDAYSTLYKGSVDSFELIRTHELTNKFTDIISAPNGIFLHYDFITSKIDTKGEGFCDTQECLSFGGENVEVCSGIYWMSLSPWDPSLLINSCWASNYCPAIDQINYHKLLFGGCTILEIDGYAPYPDLPPVILPYSQKSLYFHPFDSTALYGLSSVGLLTTNFATCPGTIGDSTWHLLKQVSNASYFYIHPIHPNRLFLTANDTLWRSNDGGVTWDPIIFSNVNQIASTSDANIFYAISADSMNRGIYRSIDSGKTFLSINSLKANSIAVDTADGSLYAGAIGMLFRSSDSGKTFYMYNNIFSQRPVISVNPDVDGNIICAAADGLFKILSSAVAPIQLAPPNDTAWLAQPAQLQWKKLSEAVSYHLQVATDSGFTNIVIEDSGLTANAMRLALLYANTQYFWRVKAKLNTPATPVWSQTWSFTTQPLLPSQTTLIAPHNDTILYNTRVDFSWNADHNSPLHYWFEIADNDSLSDPLIDSTLTDTTAALYEPLLTQTYWWRVRGQNAAGWGPFGPIYHFTMLGSNDVAEMNAPSHSGLIQNYPNPFTSSTLIRIPSNLKITSLRIYDALGREVADLSAEAISGNTSIPFDGSRFPAGVYVCRMQAGETVRQSFMTLVK